MNLMGLWAQLTKLLLCGVKRPPSFSGKIDLIKSPRMLTPNQGLVPPEGPPGYLQRNPSNTHD